jgi:hypothetical protein
MPITFELLESFYHRLKKKVNAGTWNTYVSKLKLYHTLHNLQWTIPNTVKYKRLIKTNRKYTKLSLPTNQDHEITLNELTKFITQLNIQDHDHLIFGSLATILFFGLGRVSDLLFYHEERQGMNLSSIQVNGGDYIFLVEHPKIFKTYTQYLTPIRANGKLLYRRWISLLLHSTHLNKRRPWTTRDGIQVSSRSFRKVFTDLVGCPMIGESSFRAGGATHLAQKGMPIDFIKILGRWDTDAFMRYIRRHQRIAQVIMANLMRSREQRTTTSTRLLVHCPRCKGLEEELERLKKNTF